MVRCQQNPSGKSNETVSSWRLLHIRTTGWSLVEALITSKSADQQRNVLRGSLKLGSSLALMYNS